MNRHRLPLALAGLLLPSVALACLWDYETLLQQRSRFPNTLELITGKFLRHSSEFYYWRIQDRLKKLGHNPDSLAWYDDLAVAYDKTGQHEQAIQTMLDKDKKRPGLYETEANLGTFYIHAGQLEKGLEHIGRAIQINPDAHFGREKYQKLLVEYVLSRRRDGKTPQPLAVPDAAESQDNPSFTAFLLRGQKEKSLNEPERQAAIEGVLGMMRFGNYQSPVLLEALADLLRGQHSRFPDAKRLAARAFLKASYEASDETARQAYRKMADKVLRMQLRIPVILTSELFLDELEVSFKQELAEAAAWYETVRKDELAWIREGKDPEKEFTRRYYEQPQVATHWEEGWLAVAEANKTITVVVGVLALSAIYLLVRRWRKRRRLLAQVRALEGDSKQG